MSNLFHPHDRLSAKDAEKLNATAPVTFHSSLPWRSLLLAAFCMLLPSTLLSQNGGNGDEPTASAGRQKIIQLGCTACHAIPKVPGPYGRIGPNLDGFARRPYIGGVLPNNRSNLVKWVMNPPKFSPNTAMPDMAIPESDAENIAAFLNTLE